MSAMPYCFREKLYPGVPKITLNNINENAFYIGKLMIQPIRIMHASLPILGFRIGKMAYLTDVKTLPEAAFEHLRELDVLILNALRVQTHISHLTLDEAVDLAGKIGARKTYFTHFSHDAGKHAEVERTLPDNIFLSYDNLQIEF
jgi:phosphoribosyl 1,2-cyclic phosphate phosphodiesterase